MYNGMNYLQALSHGNFKEFMFICISLIDRLFLLYILTYVPPITLFRTIIV